MYSCCFSVPFLFCLYVAFKDNPSHVYIPHCSANTDYTDYPQKLSINKIEMYHSSANTDYTDYPQKLSINKIEMLIRYEC